MSAYQKSHYEKSKFGIEMAAIIGNVATFLRKWRQLFYAINLGWRRNNRGKW